MRSPKRFALVATGVKTNETVDGNELVTTWKSEKPMTVAGFAFGEVKVEKTKAGNVEVEVYANRFMDNLTGELLRAVQAAGASRGIERLVPADRAGEIATEMANSIRLFEAFFGPYPYSRLAISTIPYSYGQGWPSLIYLSFLSFMSAYERNTLGLGLRQEKEITRFFRAHETSHQWWGHKVAWKSYHDQWLSEGFAEFSGNLYLLFDTKSWDEYRDRHKLARQTLFLRDLGGRPYDSVGPIWMGLRLNSSQSPDAYQRLVYEKGGFVLHMLRMMLFNEADDDGPDATFKAMMQEFTRTYDNKAASTEDFKAIAEKYMTPDMNLDGNARLDWFFNQYVYGTGIPTYEFKHSVTPADGGKWKLSGTVTQSGVPEGWKDVLPIYMELTVNNVKRTLKVGNMSIMQRVTPFEEILALKPERVTLCLNEDSIAVIKQ
jgi:aminopeptidase N